MSDDPQDNLDLFDDHEEVVSEDYKGFIFDKVN